VGRAGEAASGGAGAGEAGRAEPGDTGQAPGAGAEPGFSARSSVLGALEGKNPQKSRRDPQTAPRTPHENGTGRPNPTESAARTATGGDRTAQGDFHDGRGAGRPLATTLDGVLTPLRRRALGDAAFRWALLAVAGWAAAVSLLLAWSKLSPTSHVPLIAGVLGVVAALVAGSAWALHRPTVVQVARVADARLDLSERLASALFYAHASGDMEARLRADAVGAASRYKPAQAFPVRRHKNLVVGALTVALVAVLLAVTPNPQAGALARQAADREATAQARTVVASARQKLGHPTSAQAQQIANALQAALSQLAKAGTPLASLVALSNLSRQLAQLDNSSGAASQAADAAAGDALAGAPGAQVVSSDLATGNLRGAAAGLRSLAAKLSSLSSAQRRALAAALAKAAASAGYKAGASRGSTAQPGDDETFAGGLAQASSALSAGHLGSASQALKSAGGGAAATAAAVSLQQQLAADQAAVQNEEAKVAGQAQAATEGSKPGPSQHGQGEHGPGPQELGQLGPERGGVGHQSSRGLAPANNGTAGGVPAGGPGSRGSSGAGSSGAGAGGNGSGGQGSGGGTGSGSGGGGSGGGSGAGPGGRGQGGEGGPGRAKGPQSGSATKPRVGTSPSDQVFIAGQPGTGAQVVGAQVGAGGAVKTTPYQAVLPTFQKTALQDLGSHVVSPADQGAVRSYFSSLGSGG
jgi:hypothetical protein